MASGNAIGRSVDAQPPETTLTSLPGGILEISSGIVQNW
jgi:hypothetical protein